MGVGVRVGAPIGALDETEQMLRRKGAVIGQPDARGRDPQRASARIQPEKDGDAQCDPSALAGDDLDAAEYGIAVFMRWVGTGEVYARAAARRRVVHRPARELTYEERRGLVNLIVGF